MIFVLARVQICNPFAQFKFPVYGHAQTYIHTHASSNAVKLVWGSLRLAPIIPAASCRNTSKLVCNNKNAYTFSSPSPGEHHALSRGLVRVI